MSIEAEVWAPWQPKVGDRVRVRLSGECRQVWQSKDMNNGHPQVMDGVTGTVDYGWGGHSRRADTSGGHTVVVRFDVPVLVEGWYEPIPSGTVRAATFAAIELEPLEVRDV